MGKHFDFATNPKTDYPKGQYLADFLTDKAVDFINRHQDQPCFLHLPHFGVHSPHDAKAELIAKLKPKPGVDGHNNATYAAMIYSVDESVGRVMRTLDELKLPDNTVLIFPATMAASEAMCAKASRGPATLPTTLHFAAVKGAFTKAAHASRSSFAGRASRSLVLRAAYLPFTWTSSRRCWNLPVRQSRGRCWMVSLLKLFRDPSAKLERDAIFQHFSGYLGAGADSWRTTPVSLVQIGDWKLMEFLEDGRLELYNLSNDIGETKNLAAENPGKAQELHSRLIAWRAEVKADADQK